VVEQAEVDHKVVAVVLEHTKLELHLSDHIQYQQLFKLVLVVMVVQDLQLTLLELLELHLILEHQ
jgi:hypothetical protein